MKKNLFKCWVAMWIVAILVVVILNSPAWLPSIVAAMFILFLFWFGYKQVYPQIDWEDKFDYRLAFNVILFFGTMMAFIVPCLYHWDEALQWDNWCQIMVLGWLSSILYGLGYILLKEYKIIGKFWIGIITILILLIGFVFVSSILGFFFNIYLV